MKNAIKVIQKEKLHIKWLPWEKRRAIKFDHKNVFFIPFQTPPSISSFGIFVLVTLPERLVVIAIGSRLPRVLMDHVDAMKIEKFWNFKLSSAACFTSLIIAFANSEDLKFTVSHFLSLSAASSYKSQTFNVSSLKLALSWATKRRVKSHVERISPMHTEKSEVKHHWHFKLISFPSRRLPDYT